jgi:uncharacterized protein YukE
MSEMQVSPADMRSAAAAARSAAEGARGRGSSGHLATAASAIPGAQSAGFLAELGDGWDSDVEAWTDRVLAFAGDVEQASAVAESTDAAVDGLFGGLLGGTAGP